MSGVSADMTLVLQSTLLTVANMRRRGGVTSEP
jgi:hypothetical protein